MPCRSVPAFRRSFHCGKLNIFPKTQFTCLQNRDINTHVRILLLELKERSTMMLNKEKIFIKERLI